MVYKGPNDLETCAFKFCNALVYRNEAVQGKEIPGRSRGWFCTKCARVLGWMPVEERQARRRTAAAAAVFGDDATLDRYLARQEALKRIQQLPGLE